MGCATHPFCEDLPTHKQLYVFFSPASAITSSVMVTISRNDQRKHWGAQQFILRNTLCFDFDLWYSLLLASFGRFHNVFEYVQSENCWAPWASCDSPANLNPWSFSNSFRNNFNSLGHVYPLHPKSGSGRVQSCLAPTVPIPLPLRAIWRPLPHNSHLVWSLGTMVSIEINTHQL